MQEVLKSLQKDFARNSSNGKTFEYFFCPILFIDEETELCKAHIVNQSFSNVSDAWTIQRQDVDHFYGAFFESEFTKLQYAGTDVFEAIKDKSLNPKLRPKIYKNDNPIDYYFLRQNNISEHHTRLLFDDELNQAFGLKIEPQKLLEDKNASWYVQYEVNVTPDAIPSLIKAAHLTLFKIEGYKYALTRAGYIVGHNILGNFFLQNRQLDDKQQIKENAKSYFRNCAEMVRPVDSIGWESRGTIDDGISLLCKTKHGLIWARVIFVSTGKNHLHAVIIPILGNVLNDSVFNKLLAGKLETFFVRRIYFTKGQWHVLDDEWYPINWATTTKKPF